MTNILDLRRLVNGEASSHITAQVALMCSSDARAGGLLASAVAMTGVAAAVVLATSDLNLEWFFIGFGTSAAGSAAAAIWALWPITIYPPGWPPASFENDWQKSEEQLLLEMLSLAQQKIDANLQIVTSLGRRTTLAVTLLAASPVAGLAMTLLSKAGVVAGVGGLIALVLVFAGIWVATPPHWWTPK